MTKVITTAGHTVASRRVTSISLSGCEGKMDASNDPLLERYSCWNFRIITSVDALGILCMRCMGWERERERERDRQTDGSDVTFVVLNLPMSLHFPWQKDSQFSFFPSQMITIVALKFAFEFTLSVAKNNHTLCSNSLTQSNGATLIKDPRQMIEYMPVPS